MNVLFTSAGRRVALLRAFRQALNRYPGSTVIAADADPHAPALFEADDAVVLPAVRSSTYVSSLLDVCREFRIDLVIPLIDPELPVLAAASERLLRHGIRAIIADRQFVAMSSDKMQTYSGFIQAGLPVPRTVLGVDADVALSSGTIGLPVVVKPRFDQPTGVHICETDG